MAEDTKMEFARIEHALNSSPHNLSTWFYSTKLDARVFFDKFTKAPETDKKDKKIDNEPTKLQRALWTDTEHILGTTPLHLAVALNKRSPTILKQMLTLISDDHQNRYLSSTYKLLSSADFDWNVTDGEGFTPLSLALKSDDSDALSLLLQTPCLADIRCAITATPSDGKKTSVTNFLGLSVILDAMSCFRLLLEHGADISACDPKGRLPIHLAAEYGRMDAFQKLLEIMRVENKPSRLNDIYLVRQDFELLFDDTMDISELNEDEEARNASGRRNSLPNSTRERISGDYGPVEVIMPRTGQNESDLTSDDSWVDESDRNASRSPRETQGEGDMLTVDDMFRLERDMVDAGFELQQDRSGNLTATFRNRKDRNRIQKAHIGNDFGSNLLHIAVKHKQYDICYFLLTLEEPIQDVEEKRNDGVTAMHIAAQNNDVKMMQMLTEVGGAQVSPCNDVQGTRPIHTACENSAAEALDFFLSHGEDPNCRDENDFTALHYAATSKDSVACIDLLLNAGADVNATSLDMETPLYTAVSRWNIPQFWKVLRAGADPGIPHYDNTVVLGFLASNSVEELADFANYLTEHNKVRQTTDLDLPIGDEGQTALHMAAKVPSPRAIEGLLKAGANPNTEDDDGLSPLMTAMQCSKADKVDLCTTVALLLNAGADPNKETNGTKALHFACKMKFHQLVKQLLENGAEKDATLKSETALHVAAKAEDVYSMSLLLEAGANPNLPAGNQLTPLLLCAKSHFIDGLKLLVSKGVDITSCSSDGSTCMHACAELRSSKVYQIINILVSAGASLATVNTIGDLPIHTHIKNRRTEGVRSLIEAGSDINALSKNSRSPLMTACDSGHLEAVRMLIRAGAEVNLENKSKHTAIYYFARSEAKTIHALRLLFAAGANIHHKDGDGDTVLHEAALNDNATVIRFLLYRGANVNSCNKTHETALFQVAKNGFEHGTEALLRNYPRIRSANPRICNNVGVSPYEAARIGGHTPVMKLLLRAMKVTFSTFAPLSVYKCGSPAKSNLLSRGADSSIPSERTICTVCQEELEVGEQIRKLPCGHEFHDPCILPWIGGEHMLDHMNCPVCKQPIAPVVV